MRSLAWLRACVVGVVLGGASFGTAAALGQQSGKRPMTFEDLQQIKRISDPQVSANGKWVMFAAVDVDLAKNTKTSHLWVVPLASEGAAQGSERQLTSGSGETDGRFSPDGKEVAFVMNDAAGLSQIFLASWDDATGRMGEAKALTHVSTEADAPVWSPDSQRLLFVSRVYPECSDAASWAEEDACDKRK